MEDDLYKLLGLTPSCTEADIRKHFKLLSRKYHPDKNPHAAKIYSKIRMAYSVLIDPALREEYDTIANERKPQLNHTDLKSQYKNFSEFDLAALKTQHHQEVESRHAHLLSGFRERSLHEVKRERGESFTPVSAGDLKRPVRKQSSCSRALMERQEGPSAIVAIPDKYQVLVNLGEMYYRGEADRALREYVSDVTQEEWDEVEAHVRSAPSVPVMYEKERCQRFPLETMDRRSNRR